MHSEQQPSPEVFNGKGFCMPILDINDVHSLGVIHITNKKDKFFTPLEYYFIDMCSYLASTALYASRVNDMRATEMRTSELIRQSLVQLFTA